MKVNCNIGDKYGDWTVIDDKPIVKNTHRYIKVQCKCGKEDYKTISSLVNGTSTGCRSCVARRRGRDIHIGDKYKHWTVISGPTLSSYQSILWECECDCEYHTHRWMQGSELQNPDISRSCHKCGHAESIEALQVKAGKIGELCLTRYTKMKRSAQKRNHEFSVTIKYLWDLYEK